MFKKQRVGLILYKDTDKGSCSEAVLHIKKLQLLE